MHFILALMIHIFAPPPKPREADDAPRKRWVEAGFAECSECGSDNVVIHTDSPADAEFYDGDTAHCDNCGQIGQFDCDAETAGSVSWRG